MTEQTQNNQANYGMKVVGINILILVLYTLYSALTSGGIFGDAVFIAVHFLACVIFAISVKKWVWLLSGLMVIIVGFSTCVHFMGSQI